MWTSNKVMIEKEEEEGVDMLSSYNVHAQVFKTLVMELDRKWSNL